MAESFPPLHEITTGSFIVPFSPQRHRDTESQSSKAATKLKSFAFSSRASRLRGESPAQDSPRSREEREDFAKKNPFLPAKDFRVSSTVSRPRPFGLRPAGPLALLLPPHIPPRV